MKHPFPKEMPGPKMRAVYFENHGNPEELKYSYLDVPQLGPRDVLVKVHACALNHLDLWNLMGMPGVKISMPHIPGCDIAGEVVRTGPRVKGNLLHHPVIVSPGQSCGKCNFCEDGWDSLCPDYKITGFQINGGFAEYVKVPQENILKVSKKLTLEEWAAVPLVYLTAWHMLVTRARLKKGESVLIHSAGSGVGSAGIQIAKYIGARVIATVGSDEKIKRAKALGAHEVIPYHRKDFSEDIKKLTHGKGVNVVLEHIGPETFPKSLASLSKKGRLVTCGVTSGPMVSINLRFVFARQISIIGCYMGGIKELREVVRLFEKGRLRPVIDKIFPLREARAALERMKSRQHFGKIILAPN